MEAYGVWDKKYFVYIMTNRKDGVLYIGMTNSLNRRIWEHKNNKVEGFTSRYNLTQLIYAEEYPTPTEAIRREKQLKTWNRIWKIELIESVNPNWLDLSYTL